MTIERPMFPPRAESVDSFSLQPAIGQRERECRLSESRKPAEGLSRRLVLAGVASAAALPIAGSLPTTAEATTDPIFGAIEAWRRSGAAMIAVEGDIPDELGDTHTAAFKVVMRTRPITPAGLVALTCWTRELAIELEPHSNLLSEDFCALTATIDNAARGMSGLKAWSPAPAHGQNSSDRIFRIIENHRASAKTFQGAVSVEYAYEKADSKVEAMDPVERQTYQSAFQVLQEATSDAGDQMREASIDVVNTPPASLAGIIALCEYLGPQFEDEALNLPEEIDWDDGSQSTPAAAFANTIKRAVMKMNSTSDV